MTIKEDFFNIKESNCWNLFSGQRIPSEMLGIIQDNSGDYGDTGKTSQFFLEGIIAITKKDKIAQYMALKMSR